MGTMFADHAAVAVIYRHGLNEYPLIGELGSAMRLVGRMAFPLYAFLLVQGFLYTRNWKQYAARIAAFALISEIPFNLVTSGHVWCQEYQNTLFTLLAGLLCMKVISMYQENGQSQLLAAAAAVITAAEFLHTDYGAMGVLLILVFYEFRNRPLERTVFGGAVLFFMYRDLFAAASCIAFFFMNRYNGERRKPFKWLPYVFYPAHLLILYAAGELIYELYF